LTGTKPVPNSDNEKRPSKRDISPERGSRESPGCSLNDGEDKDGGKVSRRSLIRASAAGFGWSTLIDSPPSVEAQTETEGDTSAGELIWSFELDDLPHASPTVVDGDLYTGVKQGLIALDAETGERNWLFQKGEASLISSSTLYEEMIYIFGGVPPRGSSGPRGLFAVDRSTKELEWVASTGFLSLNLNPSPTTDGERVYFAANRKVSVVYGVDAETGEKEWRFKIPSYMASSPTVADGTVYVGSHGNNLYAIDAETGEEEWRFKAGHEIKSSPTVSEGMVYFGSSDGLYAVDAGVSGSSDGSRVLQGVLGHHDYLAQRHSIGERAFEREEGLSGFGALAGLVSAIGAGWSMNYREKPSTTQSDSPEEVNHE